MLSLVKQECCINILNILIAQYIFAHIFQMQVGTKVSFFPENEDLAKCLICISIAVYFANRLYCTV